MKIIGKQIVDSRHDPSSLVTMVSRAHRAPDQPATGLSCRDFVPDFTCFARKLPMWGNSLRSIYRISNIILLHEKFLQFDWLRAVVFQLNLKYLHVKITNLLRVVV